MAFWSKPDERRPLDRLIDGAWAYMGAATDAADRDARAQHAAKLVSTVLGPLGGGDALLGEPADPDADNAPRETAPAPAPAVGPVPRLSQRDRDAAAARRRMNEAIDDAER